MTQLQGPTTPRVGRGRLRAAVERVRSVLRDRWLGLVLGLWLQGCGGISYTFSLYSAEIKERLNLNQEQVDALGSSKDIGGNVGILSGLLIDFLPPWTILIIGAVLHLFGYSMLWLTSLGRIKPPLWQMCAFIMLGTNGATWFNTAVLVTCVRNFQSERGVVVGLLKGFIGLSGAIFTQVYQALFAPARAPFLQVCAFVPPIVAVATACTVRPVDPASSKDRDGKDKARFSFLYIQGLVLAFYLMVVILAQDLLDIGRGTSIFFMALMLLILGLSGALPFFSPPASPPARGAPSSSLLGDRPRAASPPPGSAAMGQRGDSGGGAASEESIPVGGKGYGQAVISRPVLSGIQKQRLAVPALDLGNKKPGAKGPNPETPSKGKKPRLGQDFTLWQAVCTQEYWLLFFAMGCGTGSGLTAINNLAQMAESLGSESIGAFVSLVSVWNFLGRLAAGYVSEYFVKKYATPRPLVMLVVQLAMAAAHLLFASAGPGSLYLGSALVGSAHGAHWTLMVAIASEMFGLRHFGALYNTLSISATLGSYLLSVRLAGYLYDRQVAAAALAEGGRSAAKLGMEALRQSGKDARILWAQGAEGGRGAALHHKCIGPDCFRSTFQIMALVCCCGALALAKLLHSTRRLYFEMQLREKDRERAAGMLGNRNGNTQLSATNGAAGAGDGRASGGRTESAGGTSNGGGGTAAGAGGGARFAGRLEEVKVHSGAAKAAGRLQDAARGRR